MADDERRWRPETKAVRAGLERTPFGETSEALFLTSGYVYDSAEEAAARFAGEAYGYVYSRYANPTVRMLEERLAALEGAEACMATASGMSAMFSALACQLESGDHVLAARQLFGSCHQVITKILPRFGISFTLVDGADIDEWRAGLRPETKVLFLESPSNPVLSLCDISAVAALAHEAGARLVVDNVFATPILQKPIELGADVVIYSTTKHIDGQGRTLGGAVLGTQEFISERLQFFLRHTGPSLSPFNAWVQLKGLETLPMRVRRMSETAQTIAEWLEERLGPGRVLYPGLASHPQRELAARQMAAGGSLVSFRLEDDRNFVFRFMNSLQLIDISNNLGDTKTLITHPASTTHSGLTEEERAAQGVTEGLVRLSVGLEHPDDLLADLEQAFEAARA